MDVEAGKNWLNSWNSVMKSAQQESFKLQVFVNNKTWRSPSLHLGKIISQSQSSNESVSRFSNELLSPSPFQFVPILHNLNVISISPRERVPLIHKMKLVIYELAAACEITELIKSRVHRVLKLLKEEVFLLIINWFRSD